MSSYLDKTGLERVWSKATDKFATIVATDELGGRILNLETNSATKQEVSDEVAKLVDSAPETLDTLNELAAALGDDPNFATTMATEIGKKVNSSDYNDAIGSINSHISTINGEIDELQEASEQHLNKEDYLGPIIKEGNPIIYDNGVEGFDIKVETTFSPKQAGSGDPYPMGGGKNLCDPSGFVVGNLVSGGFDVSSTESNVSGFVPVKPNTTYTRSSNCASGSCETAFYDSSKNYIDRVFVDTFTTPSNCYFARLEWEATYPLSESWFQLEEGSVATSYAPPSNIRPFIGYDELGLTRRGKNLFNLNESYASSKAAIEINGNSVRVYTTADAAYQSLFGNTVTLKAGTTYTLSGRVTAIGQNSGYMYLCLRKGNTIIEETSGGILSNIGSYRQTFTAKETAEVRVSVVITGGTAVAGDITLTNIMLEEGDSATSYESYKGKLYIVQIGQTVYGGKFNWLTGKLTKIWPVVTLRDLTISYKGGEHDYFEITMPTDALVTADFLCETYKTVGVLYYSAMPSTPTGCMGYYPQERVWRLKDTRYKSVDELLAGNGDMKIAYKLATPIEIQLTPTQISELEGINTLYGDGSNIRAIFNTTGGTSTTLETISGVLPVEKGGTGATSAAGARNNLGITPQNIGAPVIKKEESVSPDNIVESGFYRLSNQTGAPCAYGQLIVSRGANNGDTIAQICIPYNNVDSIKVRYGNPSVVGGNGSWHGWYDFLTSKTAVTVAQGGTGATDAATARANLGAQAALGYTPVRQGGGTGQSSTSIVKIGWAPDGSGLKCTVDATDLGYIFTSNTTVIPIANGGTGATDAATARANLGITPANIGALPSTGGTVNGILASSHTMSNVLRTTTITHDGNGRTYIHHKDGTEITNYLIMGGETTTFKVPVAIGGGGTGATTAAAARTNLDVPSRSGSGASGTWGISVTGSSASCTGNAATASSIAWSGVTSKPSYYDAKAIKGITRSGTTFTYTCMDGTTGTFTQQDNNTTYSAGNGLSLSSTTFSVSYGTSASALGTSSAGSATTVSRSDHVHALPALTSCTGTLTVAKGGTGITSNPSMLVNLGSTSAASVFATSPRPGITGTLGIGNGGTGATNKSGARTNLGITSGTTLPSSASAGDIFFLYS